MVKNTLKLIILITLILIWLPTGVSDLLVIPAIITVIGLEMYIIISILMVYFLYRTIEGRTIKDKINNVTKEVKQFI